MVARDRLRYLWLVLGALLSALAVTGRWDVALAAWVYPVLLLRFVRTARPVAALAAAGLAGCAAAVFFVWESDLGLTPLTLVLAVVLGVVFTVPYLADVLLARRGGPVVALLAFPLARVACEFALISGSPLGGVYGSLGATQHAVLPLLQVVSVTGGYGVSFLICWFATVANHVWERLPAAARPAGGWVRAAVVYAVVLAAALAAGEARLVLRPAHGPTVRVAGITPTRAAEASLGRGLASYADRRSIADAAPARVRPVLNTVDDSLLAGTAQAAAAGARIVVWPENGARVLAADEPALLGAVAGTARHYHAYVEVGVLVYTHQAPYVRDEADLLGPDGRHLWTYQKAHPIPGMEPYRAGDGRVPVARTPYGRLASVICYDADFPDQARVHADILLVPAHDWPSYGTAHAAKNSLRAVENGYALVRPDSDGRSVAVNGEGRILSTVDTTATDRPLVVDVPTSGWATPYTALGDAFAWLSLAGLALLLVIAGVRTRDRRGPTLPR